MCRLFLIIYCFFLPFNGFGKYFPHQSNAIYFSNNITSLEIVDNSFNELPPTFSDGLFKVTTYSNTIVELYMDSLQSTSGSQVSMPVYVNGFTDIISFQGSITFDASLLSYLSISNFNIPGLSALNFGTTQTGQGILTYSWYDASLQGLTVTDSIQLFSIDFTVIGLSGQSGVVSFSNSPTSLEIVDNSLNVLSTIYSDGFIANDYLLFMESETSTISIFPNIVREDQDINIKGVTLDETILVFDINGNKITNYKFDNNKIRFVNKGIYILLIKERKIKCFVI